VDNIGSFFEAEERLYLSPIQPQPVRILVWVPHRGRTSSRTAITTSADTSPYWAAQINISGSTVKRHQMSDHWKSKT
jgi:hypothetical protein